ncbi:ABC-2 type transport system permease protein [Sphingobacterium allocomposti]|uniref:ABC-2 type transport system permease protein n=1 Tax=Sphingobacterium allocomposti TaxID=415956 RepID=A0A5S5DLK8_9SPHI|nr:ABC transporter permease [Sphingobacterium composti Yoo et al. 2007 non Ten et al. 2007]TYP95692.1 ABC-2 type transport system permease protein [Sphingobacterium composti Yoo et al. 2007 non Ten et al. 2007]
MNKIALIILREYTSRVKKKSFLLTTFLVPLFFIAMYVGVFFLTKKSFEESHALVHVVDQQGDIQNKLKSNKNITYIVSNVALQEEIESLKDKEKNTNLLIIPDDFLESRRVELLSAGKPNITTQAEIREQLKEIIRTAEYTKLGIDVASIQRVNDRVTISTKEITDEGDAKESHTEIAMGVAMALSVLIYLSLFLYGAQVMRGIIEEKSNRIIEVIISSVKPFQLMIGKIVGIGLVGLTQFLLWVLLTLALSSAATTMLYDQNSTTELAGSIEEGGLGKPQSLEIMDALQSIHLGELLICFFLFFLGGYFLYSALFAAVGSAVDSETEASQFTMPITMPLLLTYVLSFGVLVNDPHGSIATWLSFIPFTSPIAMLVRIPFGVPLWQIATSLACLIVGFLITTWAASRIYRVGILMYGKKASFKELIKWFSYKR